MPKKGNMSIYQARCDLQSTNEEKHGDCLTEICKFTQDILRNQEEQNRTIQTYKQKIHLMTKDLETMQKKAKVTKNLKKVH